MILTAFDPWKSKLCTCPPKLTLNPYTGCSHRCVYCYISSYIPDFFNSRPKKDLIPRLWKEAARLKGELISISNSSDPYPPIEEALGLTQACLRVLSQSDCKLQLVTKSPLIVRDVDLLKKIPSVVAMTVTTEDDELAKTLEPFAPPPSQRLKALGVLLKEAIPVSVRIDPIISHINDYPEKLLKKLASMGVLHITCGTYKVKPDNWKRFTQAFPAQARVLYSSYFEKGERKGRSLYLPRELRLETMTRVKKLVESEGMKFSCCREGFPQLNSAVCDGTWLISSQA